MLTWVKRENNILIRISRLPVWVLTQPLLSHRVPLLTTWRASPRLTMLSVTRSAELQSESMLPQAANQVSPSEDEYSFEMREKQRIDDNVADKRRPLRTEKVSETKANKYDELPIEYTTDLTKCIVFLHHNRFHKHFDSHNYFLVPYFFHSVCLRII